jgi:membrane-bound lytic murein transglycosylase D
MEVPNTFWMPALAVLMSAQIANLGVAHSFHPVVGDPDDLRAMAPAFPQLPAEAVPPDTGTNDAAEEHSVAGTDATLEIWDRLRAGFGMSNVDDASVRTQIDRFRKQTYFIAQILQRSEPYLFHVLTRVEERGLPAELALLPVIESAYDPFARSPAGAVGIWQFMKGTADEAGLQRNWWFDGRRDIVAATEAALDYLTALHDRYDGDWQLALAAYNAGSARVNKAIRTNRSLGRPVDLRHLPLPEETREYVPKLIALRAIIEDPEAFGITLPDLADTRYFSAVRIGGALDLQVAARLAGTTLAELQRLNPGFTRSIVPPGRSHRLLVPAATARRFRERLARLPADLRVQSVRYRVQPGDTLSVIAQNSRTTVTHLRRINRLESSRIIAGSLLMVPVAEREQDTGTALQVTAANG